MGRSVDEFHLRPNFLRVGIGGTRTAEIGIFYERRDPLAKLAAQLEVDLVTEAAKSVQQPVIETSKGESRSASRRKRYRHELNSSQSVDRD